MYNVAAFMSIHVYVCLLHVPCIAGHTNRFLIDGKPIGQFSGPPREIMIDRRVHHIAFEAPLRQILIDGKLCKLEFGGPTPVIIIDNKAHGIR